MEEIDLLNKNEEWREIEDTNNRYWISSYGRVKSIINGKEKILNSKLNNKGYYRTKIKIKNSWKYVLNHKLVANRFIEHPTDNKEYVIHHIDLNPKNNYVSNLMFITVEEHIKLHKEIRNGTNEKN